MKEALSHLLNDLLSAILFFAIYLITGNIIAAAAIAMGAFYLVLAVRSWT